MIMNRFLPAASNINVGSIRSICRQQSEIARTLKFVLYLTRIQDRLPVKYYNTQSIYIKIANKNPLFFTEQLWQQDLGDTFKIDASTEGLQKVHLKCGADSMQVFLETDVDFTGVMYTKGSFYKQTEPCFRKPESGKSARSLTMRFSLDQCQTIQV